MSLCRFCVLVCCMIFSVEVWMLVVVLFDDFFVFMLVGDVLVE